MITDTAAHSICCRLSREPAQVRHARKQARAALFRWGLGQHADLAELIVSELATNAVRHGDGLVHVCVSFARCHLRVEVHDNAATRCPVRQQAADDDESGRGLALLDALIGLHGGCRGVTRDGAGRCKTVYVVICLAGDRADPVTGASAACPVTAHRHHAGKPARTGGGPHAAASCPARRAATCQHTPRCPAADAADRGAARVIDSHPEQGWSLLCNGVVVFEDSGAVLPDGTIVEPHRAAGRPCANGLLPNQTRPRGAPCRTDALVARAAPDRGHNPARRGPRQSTPLAEAPGR
jgi:anti-sigma regulatory factor (Ser/Thr protein kinase)